MVSASMIELEGFLWPLMSREDAISSKRLAGLLFLISLLLQLLYQVSECPYFCIPIQSWLFLHGESINDEQKILQHKLYKKCSKMWRGNYDKKTLRKECKWKGVCAVITLPSFSTEKLFKLNSYKIRNRNNETDLYLIQVHFFEVK